MKKEKCMSFNFDWHQHYSILLVRDTADLARLKLDFGDDKVGEFLSVKKSGLRGCQDFYASFLYGSLQQSA